jgi:hypothetical protein
MQKQKVESRKQKSGRSHSKACAAGPIVREGAFSVGLSTPCCVSARPGHSSGVKLSSLPLQAQTSWMSRFAIQKKAGLRLAVAG